MLLGGQVEALRHPEFAEARLKGLLSAREARTLARLNDAQDFAESSEDDRVIDALYDVVVAHVQTVLTPLGFPASPLGLNAFFGLGGALKDLILPETEFSLKNVYLIT